MRPHPVARNNKTNIRRGQSWQKKNWHGWFFSCWPKVHKGNSILMNQKLCQPSKNKAFAFVSDLLVVAFTLSPYISMPLKRLFVGAKAKVINLIKNKPNMLTFVPCHGNHKQMHTQSEAAIKHKCIFIDFFFFFLVTWRHWNKLLC